MTQRIDNPEAAAVERAEKRGLGARLAGFLARYRNLVLAAIGVGVVDVIAAIAFPQPGFPDLGASILANIEQIPPKTVIDFAPGDKAPATSLWITAHPSITATLFTMWILMALIVILAWLLTRRTDLVPGPVQNFVEFAVEAARNFVVEVGGMSSMRYVPLFGTLFIFILFSNWTDLFLFGEKSNYVRTPTSDINITIGLAIVSFCTFQFEGMRKMGVRGYLGKFFTLAGFKRGPFDGFIDLYIGVLEFFLEFFKPLTLAVRLFGNIYGGGIMLGVMTSLLVFVAPTTIVFLVLEGFIGVVQALVFALLTLMFTLTALESHDEEAHAAPAFATEPEGNLAVPTGGSGAH